MIENKPIDLDRIEHAVKTGYARSIKADAEIFKAALNEIARIREQRDEVESLRQRVRELEGIDDHSRLAVSIILGHGEIAVGGSKKKTDPFMDTLSFENAESKHEIGEALPLNQPKQGPIVLIQFTKAEAVDVVIGILLKIKANFIPTPTEGAKV